MSNSLLSLAIKTSYPGIYKKETSKGIALIARYTVDKKTKTQIIGYEKFGMNEYDAFKQRQNLISSEQLATIVSQDKQKENYIPKLFSQFIQYKKPFFAKNTLENYQSIFNKYINVDFKNKDIREITSNDLQNYINSLLHYRRPATVEKIVSSLKKFYIYLQDNDIYRYNAASNIQIPKYDNKKYFSISKRDVKRIITYINNIDSILYKTLYLMLLHGRRIGEILNLKWSDIDLGKKIYYLHYSKTKTRKNQYYYLEDFQIIALQQLKEEKDNTIFVFESNITKKPIAYTSFFRVHTKLRQKLNLGDFNIHAIRHMVAFLIVNNGYSLEITAKVLGHQSIQSTSRYAVLEMNQAKDAYNKVIGKFF
ncbi:tyrosine-type recombinase/integrase [Aliarcobacter butzleri]|uniref:tyrosine-type recombinase/integrase n=1 Tax=Aliarcobacter butzleri TaxID=28197 RepID=UPI002B24DDB3|nr:tyrosine-type recombinase/integrase [Aliarcobacter butzleri]